MAWVEKRPSKRTGLVFTYRVCDVDHGREIVLESGFERKKDALALARRIDGEKARGKRLSLEGRRITLGERFEAFMSTRVDLAPSTLSGYRSSWRLHIELALGDVLVRGHLEVDGEALRRPTRGRWRRAAHDPRLHKRLRKILQEASTTR